MKISKSILFLILIFFASIKIFASDLLVTDFDNADKINDLDGIYDSWSKDPQDPTMGCSITYSKEHRYGDTGYALRIDYDVDSPNEAYNGVWMRLEGVDLSTYQNLEFDIKGDAELGYTSQLNLEIKSDRQSSKYPITGITDQYQHKVIPFSRFKGITDFSNMEELVLVFVDQICNIKKGRIYIDNLKFTSEPYLPEDLMIADFQMPQPLNNLGGDFNSWTRDPNSENEYCNFEFIFDSENKKNIILQIEYKVEDPVDSYNGMWFKLTGIDLSDYKKLTMKVRGDQEFGFPQQFQLEIKTKINFPKSDQPSPNVIQHQTQSSKITVPVDNEWKLFQVPLADFAQINNWENTQELVIVFDKTFVSNRNGKIYIDDITFSKKSINRLNQDLNQKSHKIQSRSSLFKKDLSAQKRDQKIKELFQ